MDLTARLIDAPPAVDVSSPSRESWAASGAMALTGRRDGPPLAMSPGVVDTLSRLAARLRETSGSIGREVVLDGAALLGERAACTGWTRAGTTSVGGATRLLRAGDGDWLAVSIARGSDRELLPAWLGVSGTGELPEIWPAIEDALGTIGAADAVERAALVGLACARLGEVAPHGLTSGASLAGAVGSSDCLRRFGDLPASLTDVIVVDLSSLWAGPLCGDLLARAGATVVKVESAQRPDGARSGNAAFFDLLNGTKASVVVDVTTAKGRLQLRQLIEHADVVIEASRPRALRQLGVCVADVARAGRLRVWLSLTSNGRHGDQAMRVAFGDDAAVAGGLVAWEDGEPRFAADAIADPASGLVAAVAVLDRLLVGGQWLVDVALSRTAAFLASASVSRRGIPEAAEADVGAPRARAAVAPARSFGADTDAVLDTWAIA